MKNKRSIIYGNENDDDIKVSVRPQLTTNHPWANALTAATKPPPNLKNDAFATTPPAGVATPPALLASCQTGKLKRVLPMMVITMINKNHHQRPQSATNHHWS